MTFDNCLNSSVGPVDAIIELYHNQYFLLHGELEHEIHFPPDGSGCYSSGVLSGRCSWP